MRPIIDDAFIAMLESRELCVHNPMNGLFGGSRRSRAYGSSTEFADYREYEPGDDLRRVDWNLYARLEKMYLKLFVDEKQLHHRIYIDASSSMDWGKPNKAHTALKIAAALGFLSVQAMDRVSFFALHGACCDDLCRTVFGREGFYRAVGSLNSVSFYCSCDISNAIMSQESVGDGDGISVIISDLLTDADWQGAVHYLQYKRREVLIIRVLSRDEIGPSLSGKVFMLDSEALSDDDALNYKADVTYSRLNAYEEAFRYHEREIRRFCADRGVGLLTVCSDESIEKILFMKATEGGLIK